MNQNKISKKLQRLDDAQSALANIPVSDFQQLAARIRIVLKSTKKVGRVRDSLEYELLRDLARSIEHACPAAKNGKKGAKNISNVFDSMAELVAHTHNKLTKKAQKYARSETASQAS